MKSTLSAYAGATGGEEARWGLTPSSHVSFVGIVCFHFTDAVQSEKTGFRDVRMKMHPLAQLSGLTLNTAVMSHLSVQGSHLSSHGACVCVSDPRLVSGLQLARHTLPPNINISSNRAETKLTEMQLIKHSSPLAGEPVIFFSYIIRTRRRTMTV